MSQSPVQQFEQYLQARGLRLTRQRQLIAKSFFATKGHSSTEELYRRVQESLPEIGYATVYRTLKLLSAAGLASGRNFKDGFVRFEKAIDQEHHDHLVCTGCGKIAEFRNDEIESQQERVAREHGFRVTDHSLEIYGLCQRCNKD